MKPFSISADHVWDGSAFREGWSIDVTSDGRIGRAGPADGPVDRHHDRCALVPGFVNAHSHAFQVLLRGAVEQYGPDSRSNFWSWRDRMYETVGRLEPDSVFDASLQCFTEMVRGGWTTVGEFHYVRHAGDSDLWALDDAVIQAAMQSGIRIVLLQACYLAGDVDQPLAPEQSRFDSGSVDRHLEQHESLAQRYDSDLVEFALAAHSVRAVGLDDLLELARASEYFDRPLHIHLEENLAEIESCLRVHGKTPMRLLIDNELVTPRMTAVHCTHSHPVDLADFAAAGGRICLCPMTEGNLADGIVDMKTIVEHGIPVCAGSDMNLRQDPFEEVRWIEYVQRLASLGRGVFTQSDRSHGACLLQVGTCNGAASLAVEAGDFNPGSWADMLILDIDGYGPGPGQLLEDSIVTGCGPERIVSTIIGGRVVHDRPGVGREPAS